MAKTKIAVTLESRLLDRVDELVAGRRFRNRSQAIETALAEKLDRLARTRLARECALLDAREEKRLAEEGLAGGVETWPEYRTLAIERIGRRITRASDEEVDRVVEGLNEIIG